MTLSWSCQANAQDTLEHLPSAVATLRPSYLVSLHTQNHGRPYSTTWDDPPVGVPGSCPTRHYIYGPLRRAYGPRDKGSSPCRYSCIFSNRWVYAPYASRHRSSPRSPGTVRTRAQVRGYSHRYQIEAMRTC